MSAMSVRRKNAAKRDYNDRAVVVNVPRSSLVGMPPQFRVTLRASATYTTNLGASTVSHGVGCNTPIAPFKTVSTGEVPGYLTWLQQAYDVMYTIRSVIKIELINTTVADSVYVVLSRDSNTVVVSDIDDLSETRGAQTRTLGYYSAGNNAVRLKDTFTPYQALGIAWNSADNAVKTGDPGNPYYWIISVKSSGGGTGNISYRVFVEYDLEFTKLAAPAP